MRSVLFVTAGPGTLRGKVITYDPGHIGGNSRHAKEISRLVDIGNGTKACNTVGTATNDGYPEHALTWDVSVRVAAELRSHGARVVMTHPDDTGWGPCSVDRAAIANRADSVAAVSIHASIHIHHDALARDCNGRVRSPQCSQKPSKP